MKTILLGTAAAVVLAAASFAQGAPMPAAGAYTLDKNHSSITWKVNHLGTSTYVSRFNTFDAKLNFDPKAPDKSTLEVTIDPNSLDINYTDGDKFYNELTGKDGNKNFFNTAQYPAITFKSTKIELTGEKTGKATGDLTLLGQTHPITLDITFNGSRPGFGPNSPPPVVGFSAKTIVKRSQWGFSYGVPNVGDDVEVSIETEFASPKA